MRIWIRHVLWASLALFSGIIGQEGQAWHHPWWSGSARSAYISPGYSVGCCVPVIVCPQVVPLMPYAQTMAAPPSGTPVSATRPAAVPQSKEPPLGLPLQKAPTVTETRSQIGAYGGTKERCKVGFWNVTGRDITVTIDGAVRKLGKDRAVTLELDRTFVWQLDDQPPASERVPVDQAFYELIIRK